MHRGGAGWVAASGRVAGACRASTGNVSEGEIGFSLWVEEASGHLRELGQQGLAAGARSHLRGIVTHPSCSRLFEVS